jgi:hypothetical protein
LGSTILLAAFDISKVTDQQNEIDCSHKTKQILWYCIVGPGEFAPICRTLGMAQLQVTYTLKVASGRVYVWLAGRRLITPGLDGTVSKH